IHRMMLISFMVQTLFLFSIVLQVIVSLISPYEVSQLHLHQSGFGDLLKVEVDDQQLLLLGFYIIEDDDDGDSDKDSYYYYSFKDQVSDNEVQQVRLSNPGKFYVLLFKVYELHLFGQIIHFHCFISLFTLRNILNVLLTVIKLFESSRLEYFSPDQLILDLASKHCFIHQGWRKCCLLCERLLLELFGGLTYRLVLLQLFEPEVRPVLVYCVVFQIILIVVYQSRGVDLQLNLHYSVHSLNLHPKLLFFFSYLFPNLTIDKLTS
ncbi:MAG: hypothetical protein EZS28_045624, partial [Streblomastix strix]